MEDSSLFNFLHLDLLSELYFVTELSGHENATNRDTDLKNEVPFG